ncbi:MAG: putative adenylyl cyclase CyaB [Bacteroidetes bacterium]|nr:putative adenylyl cyclase CyaB [Bacteroidota bacterium]
MPKNFELKSHYDSLSRAKRIARAIGAAHKGTLRQVDTYFKVRSGRLKLREIDGEKFELIYYERANAKSSRCSDYRILPLAEPRSARDLFRVLFGISVVVRKKRTLFLYQNARIHIDSVERLGTFIEFEVVVNRGKKQARALMQVLRKEFRIDPRSLVGGSYSDMIRRKG